MLSIFLFFSFIQAQELQNFDVGAQTRFFVQCPQLQLRMTGESNSNKVNANSSSRRISIRRDQVEDSIKVECEADDPKLSLQIQGRSLISEIHIKRGSVSISNWSSSVHTTMEKGSISYKKISGIQKAFLSEGQIDIEDATARIKAEAFNAKINLQKIDASIDVTNFLGSTLIKKITGDVSAQTRSGQINISDVSGSLKFDFDNGKLDAEAIEGSIEGESGAGQANLKLSNPVRLKANIKNGQYKILVPNSSGAQVYMGFEDGQFNVPSFLKQDTYGSTKVVRGQLRGNETGRLNLSGDSARIQLGTY